MFCKGAETSILPLCNQNNLIEKINEHIRFFALQGLRTLAVAYKELTEDEFQKMNKGKNDKIQDRYRTEI